MNNKNLYFNRYTSPLGLSNLLMFSDGEFLTGLIFEDSNDTSKFKTENACEKKLVIFDETKQWLDIYFSGEKPSFTPKFKIDFKSKFQKQVISFINEIEFGKTTTYGDIASKVAKENGLLKMSAEAVGHAVGSNPICIIVPCHRVVGKNGQMVGYGGGLSNKIKLLNLEKENFSNSTPD